MEKPNEEVEKTNKQANQIHNAASNCMEKDKYFSLMRYANNPVGADFTYCTETELHEVKKEFNPIVVEEISKEDYDYEMERIHRKFMRLATGYPK